MGIADLDGARHLAILEQTEDRLRRELVAACPLCRGTGTTIVHGWDDEADVPKDRVRLCSCRVELNDRIALMEAGVPEELYEVDSLVPTLNTHAFELADVFVANLESAMARGLSLLFTGKNGAGKTSAAAKILLGVLRAGRTAALISWPDYVDGLRRAWKEPAHGRWLDDRVMRDVAVFDELGKEHQTTDTSFVIGKLDSVLRMRRGANLPTIITTNLTPAEVVSRYGASMDSLLADRFKVVAFRPGDFRKRSGFDWNAALTGEKDA